MVICIGSVLDELGIRHESAKLAGSEKKAGYDPV
jgi:hypothetical protein